MVDEQAISDGDADPRLERLPWTLPQMAKSVGLRIRLLHSGLYYLVNRHGDIVFGARLHIKGEELDSIRRYLRAGAGDDLRRIARRQGLRIRAVTGTKRFYLADQFGNIHYGARADVHGEDVHSLQYYLRGRQRRGQV